MHVIPWFPRKDKHLLNGKEIDDSRENMFGITDGHQNYEKCECKVRIVILVHEKRTGKGDTKLTVLKLPICNWRLGFYNL